MSNTSDLTNVVNEYQLCTTLGVVGLTGHADGFVEVTATDQPRRKGPWSAFVSDSDEWCWVTAGRGRFVDVWLPREIAEPLAGTRVREGKITVRGPGRPCEVRVDVGHDSRIYIPRTCGQIVVEDGLCNRHLSNRNRERAKDAERQERRDRNAAEAQRRREADRAAREALERDADLLEDLGLGGLETDGAGHVSLTVEQLIGLVRQIP